MIILDTNVISEFMRHRPDPAALEWLDRQPPTSIWTTAITVLECRYGIELLPEGRRRQRLTRAFERIFDEDLSNRILVFDRSDAAATAEVMARRHASGRPGELRDSMIAGMVKTRLARLATRNTRHFEDADIDLVDPWSA